MQRTQAAAHTALSPSATPEDSSGQSASRRQFFRVGGLFAAGLAASSALAPVTSWAGTMSQSTTDDIAILNVALGLEYQAIAAYQVGAESGLLEKPVLAVAVKFQGQHKAHAEVLSSTIGKLGGTPVMAKKPDEYGFPTASLKSQADVLEFAAGLEKGAASAYLGAVPQFHNKDLAKAAASIMGDETMHWAILLNALGKDPVPAAFIA
ncbi:putative Ferritin/ribonucleotide reductase [Thiomonas arsenitoxydans]|uniref:Ferritin/ribonucleotide reductase n=1 Tax=Thiomonas arsenitoxydans (strain DSM 22701 / CIP 110005 / 3As) TaxID=426114 RepID=D6CM66_THIA3|nr:ferritin-like domain-containing protein [Thiomonas arsenitoxydans]CQR43475.1 putative Ferritin/ribonucleotide reductase [Thiomonas sp. CB3]CAZ89644.1 putative Ferritin/ribonucleotide reductase [Thiomonas arsenitoxydans]CQR26767.1 putative Ferritin/ribonucleotide reductase [Thiomonas arsenitoxydans]CQR36585.1 putative Ferritin/ribonucleotide reductase [Thiomonas arsenitoxydans]CQR38944.1 putative Ferritin/ribonucleotide reductase [Thiomonas arsenitoxydans]